MARFAQSDSQIQAIRANHFIGDRKSLSIAKNHPKPSQEFSEEFGPPIHKTKGFSRNSPQKVHPNLAKNLGREVFWNTFSGLNFRVPEPNPAFFVCESRFGGLKIANCRFEAVRANQLNVTKIIGASLTNPFVRISLSESPASRCELLDHPSYGCLAVQSYALRSLVHSTAIRFVVARKAKIATSATCDTSARQAAMILDSSLWSSKLLPEREEPGPQRFRRF